MRLKTHTIVLAALLGAFIASVVGPPVVAWASRNSGGTYSLPAGNPVVTGTSISSTWANTTLGDLGAELTNSLDRNGRGAMLAPLECSAGSVSAPGLAFSAETNSGLYRAGSHDVRMAINGADVGKWTTSGVAITGTHTVSGNQTVAGSVTAQSTGSNFVGDVAIDNAGTNAGTVTSSLRFGSTTSGEAIASKRTSTGNQFGLDIYTGSIARMSFSNTGGVQIPGATAGTPGTSFSGIYGLSSTGVSVPSVAANSCTAFTGQTLNGISTGGVCLMSTDPFYQGLVASCSVTAANTFADQVCNTTGSTISPSGGTLNFRIRVIQP